MRLIKVTVLWDVNTMQSGRYVPAFWGNPLLHYSIQEETASSVLLGARDFLFSKTFRPALFNLLNLFNRSSLGIATRYRLDGPGIESLWEARFSAPIQTGSEAHPASYTKGTGSFPEVNRLGRGVDHPLPSSAEVKERVELYLYSPSGPLWPVIG